MTVQQRVLVAGFDRVLSRRVLLALAAMASISVAPMPMRRDPIIRPFMYSTTGKQKAQWKQERRGRRS